MLEAVEGLYKSVDKKVLAIIISVLIIVAVISFIKKVVKLALIICVVIVLVTSGSFMTDGLTKSSGISISKGVLHIDNGMVDNFSLDLSNVENVVISKGSSDNSSNIVITANGKKQTIELNDKYIMALRAIFKGENIEVVEK